MNKKWLYLIILFICLSLAGIITVQYLWIRNAFYVREAQFNQEANDALGKVINRLETSENMALIQSRLISDSIMTLIHAYAHDSLLPEQLDIDLDQLREMISGNGSTDAFGQPHMNISTSVYVSDHGDMPSNYQMSFYWNIQEFQKIDSIMKMLEDEYLHKQEFEQQVEERVIHYFNPDIIVVDPSRHPPPPTLTYSLPKQRGNTRRIERSSTWKNGSSAPNGRSFSKAAAATINIPNTKLSLIIEEKIKKLNKRTQSLEELIKRMAMEYEEIPRNVVARVNQDNLRDILTSSLADNNIHIPFEFAVFNPANDSNPLPIRSSGFADENTNTPHHVSLFPNDVIEKPEQLLVFFPNEQSHIIESLSVLLLGSLLFTLIIISSSGLSIFVMIRQKKNSDIKTDFINNMTHEFKTPIATISIAADSIVNPKVIQTPKQIKDYIRIIKEENARMNASVEQVLQMSFLDSRDFQLTKKPVNMQELINRSVEHFRLIVEKRDGTLSTNFQATSVTVMGDESHLRNMVMNLLDNANKYSLECPTIMIYTENRSTHFLLSVSDTGMGMSPEVQKRIFDKFYRVTTGNVHNIKGFGLGLSYVKAIILAHNGEIRVTSDTGKGSRFDIFLPLFKAQNHNALHQ